MNIAPPSKKALLGNPERSPSARGPLLINFVFLMTVFDFASIAAPQKPTLS